MTTSKIEPFRQNASEYYGDTKSRPSEGDKTDPTTKWQDVINAVHENLHKIAKGDKVELTTKEQLESLLEEISENCRLILSEPEPRKSQSSQEKSQKIILNREEKEFYNEIASLCRKTIKAERKGQMQPLSSPSTSSKSTPVPQTPATPSLHTVPTQSADRVQSRESREQDGAALTESQAFGSDFAPGVDSMLEDQCRDPALMQAARALNKRRL